MNRSLRCEKTREKRLNRGGSKMVSYKKKFTEMKERQLISKARDCLERGEIENGIDFLTKVIDINPRNVEAFSRRLEANFNRGEYELALDDVERALVLDPTIPDLHAALAAILYRKKDYEGALVSNATALKVMATRDLPYSKIFAYECYVRRADIFALLKKYQEAISECGEAISLNPCAESYYQRAYYLCEINEHEKALSDIKKAILLNKE